jgi:2-oxo-4-hydroxy-4-carboxy-5-ureidoimidazoline decarboxylase
VTAPLTVEAVNAMDRDEFVAAFGHVLEHSPAHAASAWTKSPFADRAAIVDAFVAVLEALDEPDALELLCAHPELGSRRPMATASVTEQAGAGLDRIASEGQRRLDADNRRYRERFGFPFIVAVRGMTSADVAVALAGRLDHDHATERAEALRQVARIAAFRVEEAVVGP